MTVPYVALHASLGQIMVTELQFEILLRLRWLPV